MLPVNIALNKCTLNLNVATLQYAGKDCIPDSLICIIFGENFATCSYGFCVFVLIKDENCGGSKNKLLQMSQVYAS